MRNSLVVLSVFADEFIMAITGNSFLEGFAETVCATNDGICFLRVTSFVTGSANWVTGLSKRKVDSSRIREMLSRAYVFETGTSTVTSRTIPVVVNSDCCCYCCYHYHHRRRCSF
jgi:hypothetical protein